MEYGKTENKSVTIGNSWLGTILTVAIVATRAFQPGSEPMSEWSFTSWLWMTLPLTWPFAAFSVWGIAWLFAAMLSATFKKRS